jgi:hypothetical protein
MSARIAESAALQRAQLKKSFAGVPVGLKLLGGPINPTNPSIFQMNIHRSRRFGEYFQIWPGGPRNEIEVLSSDQSFSQLVMRVKEPRWRFVQIVRKNPWTSDEAVEARARAVGGRILKETRYDWRVEMWTPDVDRRYLCGKDDLHLFIAHIEGGNSVPAAHESLMPQAVRQAEVLWPGEVTRQGEWFFVPPTDEESERLLAQLKDRPRALKLRAPVGQGGTPHVADSVAVIDHRMRSAHREYRVREVYARGAVVHPEHRPLWLKDWRKVVRNRELGGSGDALRIPWID